MVNKSKPEGNRPGFASFSTGGHVAHHRAGRDTEAEVKVPVNKTESKPAVEKTDLDAFAASAALETAKAEEAAAKIAELEAAAEAEALAEAEAEEAAAKELDEALKTGLQQAEDGDLVDTSEDSGGVEGGVNVDTPFHAEASTEETPEQEEEDMTDPKKNPGLAKASPNFEEVDNAKAHANTTDEEAAIEANVVEETKDQEDSEN